MGSVNPHTRLQLEDLWLSQRCKNVFVETRALLEGEEQWEQEVQRVVDAILQDVDKDRVFTVTGDGIYPENRVDLAQLAESRACQIEEISNKMNLAFAEIAHRICEREKSFKGIYSSGGDVTVSICKRFQTAGLSLKEAVLPLAAHGEMLRQSGWKRRHYPLYFLLEGEALCISAYARFKETYSYLARKVLCTSDCISGRAKKRNLKNEYSKRIIK